MNSSRPNSVKLAICCLAISFAISLIQAFVRADFKTGGFAYQIFGFFIVLFLVFMIYRRKNWARWIYAGCLVIWLVTLVVHLRFLTELTIVHGILLAVQLILWTTAAFMLFVPAANNWFRIPKESA
jgi:hypothetical protein